MGLLMKLKLNPCDEKIEEQIIQKLEECRLIENKRITVEDLCTRTYFESELSWTNYFLKYFTKIKQTSPIDCETYVSELYCLLKLEEKAMSLGSLSLLCVLDVNNLIDAKSKLLEMLDKNSGYDLINEIAAYLISFPEKKPEVLFELEKRGLQEKVEIYKIAKEYDEEKWHSLLKNYQANNYLKQIVNCLSNIELHPRLIRGFLQIFYKESILQESLCKLLIYLKDEGNSECKKFAQNILKIEDVSDIAESFFPSEGLGKTEVAAAKEMIGTNFKPSSNKKAMRSTWSVRGKSIHRKSS
jgi:hypothetical protein